MRRPVLVLFSLGIAIVLLMSACASGSSSSPTTSSPNAPRGYKPTPVRTTDAVSLPDYATDPSGVAFPFKAAPGNLLVVYFDFLTHFFPNSTIHALRAADSLQLSAVTSQFGAQWQVDPHEPGATTYGVAHSGVTYVVDDRGQLVWEWPFGTTGPEVAATLNQFMDTVYPTS